MWNKQSTALESRIHSSIPGSLCVLHFVSRKPLLLYILEKRIILRYLNRNKIRGEERSNRGVKNQRQNCASAIALRLGGGGVQRGTALHGEHMTLWTQKGSEKPEQNWTSARQTKKSSMSNEFDEFQSN